MKKNSSNPGTIDEYIRLHPAEVQNILMKIRALIVEVAPDAAEAIKYRMPTFVLNGNLVHFAAFKNHIGFYPAPSGIIRFQKELSGYVTSKGAIQFQLDEPIPYPLIRKILKFRVQENLG